MTIRTPTQSSVARSRLTETKPIPESPKDEKDEKKDAKKKRTPLKETLSEGLANELKERKR